MTLDGKVLIVGGGLAGLTLANVLQHHDIPYQVFERDAGPDARDQGFSLNVHFCLEPLGKSINPVKFAKFGRSCAVDPERPESTELRLVDGRTSKVLHEPFRGNDLNQKPEMYRVCRSRLRSWLMEGIDVQWNKQIDHYTATPEKVRITFTDGTEATGSILVGADGINSAVCEQLLGSEEFKKSTVQNPVSNLSATYLIDQATRDVYDKFSKTHMIVLGRYQQMCTRLFISLVDVDRTAQEARYKMMWSVSCIDPDEPLLETDAQKLERAKALVTEFDTPFKNLVHNTPADVPVNRWPLRERSPHAILETHPEFDRVVLIGDAAHGLTPYRGEGGNHAMLDAVLLGNALTNVQSGKRNLNEAIDDFYNEMLPRTRKAVAESHDASITMHGPPEQVEQLLQRTLNHYKERMKQLKEEEA